jgi:hypothetical protein
MYLDRLKRRDPSVRITSNNFQRFLLIAIMESCKFFEDNYYSNKHWAHIGNITNREINELELDFLFRMSFKLAVTREEYDEFVQQIYMAALPMELHQKMLRTTSADHAQPREDVAVDECNDASAAVSSLRRSNSEPCIASSMQSCPSAAAPSLKRSNSESTITSSMLSCSSTPRRMAAQASDLSLSSLPALQAGKGFYLVPDV